MEEIDEVAAHTLIAEGIDPATAVAGSTMTTNRPRASWRHDRWFQAGVILGLVISLVVWAIWLATK